MQARPGQGLNKSRGGFSVSKSNEQTMYYRVSAKKYGGRLEMPCAIL